MSSEASVLGVTLNRDRLNQALAPASFAADGDFVVVLRNEGEPVHVHLRFDGPLAAAASVSTSNHFVDADATRRVRVSVPSVGDPVEGTLEVVVGHGAAGTEVPVTLTPAPEPADESAVSPAPDSAGSPPAAAANDSSASRAPADPGGDGTPAVDAVASAATPAIDRLRNAPPDPATVGVVVVAAAALVGALVVGLAFDGLAVSLGVAAVVVAVAVALWLLVG